MIMDTDKALSEKHCAPCEGGVQPIGIDEAKKLLDRLKGWELGEDGKEIIRHFKFKNFYHTMAFVNAVAWIANQENHHPDLAVGYDYCTVRYFTHAISGLSDNDFICAAKVDRLIEN